MNIEYIQNKAYIEQGLNQASMQIVEASASNSFAISRLKAKFIVSIKHKFEMLTKLELN